jgi:uracil-DNA glycosylase family 4
MSGLSREEAIAALRWLINCGADEAIGDVPVNRLLAPAPAPQKLSVTPPPEKPGPISQAPPVSFGVESAGRIAASCSSLAELKAALMAFEGCELKRHATNTVFADGNPAGGIMFIGEAPGAEEDRQGLPFVGRAGQLLDRMLASIGLDRRKVYITNIVNWRPPANREPSPEEASICLPFLHRHVELANPKVLVLLGAVPARHLMGVQGIMRSRGRWETYRLRSSGREIPTMLTLHPAYLLRQSSAKRLVWNDFLEIAEKISKLGLAT